MGNWISFGGNWGLNHVNSPPVLENRELNLKNKSQINDNYFTSYFIMGGHKFDRSDPETFLFGDISDLKYLGSNPMLFPYKAPMWFEPIRTLKSLIHIRKDTLKFIKYNSDSGNTKYNIEFVFDADVKIAITIYYFATEQLIDGKLIYTLDERNLKSQTYDYESGDGQTFNQPSHIFEPALYMGSAAGQLSTVGANGTNQPSPSNDESGAPVGLPRAMLSWLSRGSLNSWRRFSATGQTVGHTAPTYLDDTVPNRRPAYNGDFRVADGSSSIAQYPVVISCVTRDSDVNRQVHVTLATVDYSRDESSGGFVLKPLKQKLLADGLSFLIQEVYGIENKNRKVFARSPTPTEPRPRTSSAVPVTTGPQISATAEESNATPTTTQKSHPLSSTNQDGRTIMNLIMNHEPNEGLAPSISTTPATTTSSDTPSLSLEDHVTKAPAPPPREATEVVVSGSDGSDDEDAFVLSNAECVVCLSALRDTVILPCRHMCLCHACGNALRYQACACPVCRVPFKALLRCKVLRRKRLKIPKPTATQDISALSKRNEVLTLSDGPNSTTSTCAQNKKVGKERKQRIDEESGQEIYHLVEFNKNNNNSKNDPPSLDCPKGTGFFKEQELQSNVPHSLANDNIYTNTLKNDHSNVIADNCSVRIITPCPLHPNVNSMVEENDIDPTSRSVIAPPPKDGPETLRVATSSTVAPPLVPSGIIPKGFETVPLIEALNGPLPHRTPPVFNLVSSAKLASRTAAASNKLEHQDRPPVCQHYRSVIDGLGEGIIPCSNSPDHQAKAQAHARQQLLGRSVPGIDNLDAGGPLSSDLGDGNDVKRLNNMDETIPSIKMTHSSLLPHSPDVWAKRGDDKSLPHFPRSRSERIIYKGASNLYYHATEASLDGSVVGGGDTNGQTSAGAGYVSKHHTHNYDNNNKHTTTFSPPPLYSLSYPLTSKSFRSSPFHHNVAVGDRRNISKSCKCLYTLLPTCSNDTDQISLEASPTIANVPDPSLPNTSSILYIDDAKVEHITACGSGSTHSRNNLHHSIYHNLFGPTRISQTTLNSNGEENSGKFRDNEDDEENCDALSLSYSSPSISSNEDGLFTTPPPYSNVD